MLELVAALNEDLAKFAPAYTADPKKAIYRIYRDTRFSADKTPYKTHIAAIFPKKGGERGSTPGFYFGIFPRKRSASQADSTNLSRNTSIRSEAGWSITTRNSARPREPARN